jgi:hypothetical protein
MQVTNHANGCHRLDRTLDPAGDASRSWYARTLVRNGSTMMAGPAQNDKIPPH